MLSTEGGMEVGIVKVGTVSNRGFTPEEIAEQAEAFRKEIKGVLVSYLRQAVVSHNTTLTNRFKDAGHPELVKLLEV